jgi:DNA-binding NtrC family response regulator
MSTAHEGAERSSAKKSIAAGARQKVRDAEAEKAPWVAPTPCILVVDDDPLICQQLERLYLQGGYKATTAYSGEQALDRLQAGDIDAVVTDIRLGGMSGVDLAKRMQELHPDVAVIAVTGFGDIEVAVEVLKLGASDFILKPFKPETILDATRAVVEKARALIEIRHLRRSLKGTCEFGGILSKTPEMHRVFEVVSAICHTDLTVLIEGETGTGKDLIANAIHYKSPRCTGPFIALNCAGVPETLLESELFGYERGAFTGADQTTVGKIELAHRGTLFLDEIESMSLAMQAKLLRVFENREVQRLGGHQKIRVDVRVIAASNVPLKDLLDRGQMRHDFYYRINVMPIRLIPLRERKDDIPLLVHDFLRHHPLALSKKITGISHQAVGCLVRYPWPGNVRELQNVLERAIVLTTKRVIDHVDLPDLQPPARMEVRASVGHLPLRQWLSCQEKEYLLQQLREYGGKIADTARNCGMDMKTLYRKMRLYGLDKRDFQEASSSAPVSSDKTSIEEKVLSSMISRNS